MNTEIPPQLINMLITIVLGFIGFFLKRTINDVDLCRQDINRIKEHFATKESMEKFREDVSEKLDTIQNDLNKVQLNYIPKDDFFKEMAKIDKKMDRIQDLIIDNIKGEKRSE